MLRILFTSEDLARTRVAATADPLWEIALSMFRLTGRRGRQAFALWRRRTRHDLARLDGLDTVRRVLGPLFPAHASYFPDFLTPPHGGHGLGAGADAVLSTPRPLLRRELDKLVSRTGTPSWAWGLADGRMDAFHDLRDGLCGYFDAAIAPHWSEVQAMVNADRAKRGRAYLDGGVGHLLASFSPVMRWRPPVLSMDHPVHREVRLGGRGLVLIPSYFCWGAPVALASPELPQVLVYPIERDHPPATPRRPSDSAGARLLGPTRAALLRSAVDGATTGELARHHGISPSGVSQHTQVLREAGLIVSRRSGGNVIHTVTPLGAALLTGAGLPLAPGFRRSHSAEGHRPEVMESGAAVSMRYESSDDSVPALSSTASAAAAADSGRLVEWARRAVQMIAGSTSMATSRGSVQTADAGMNVTPSCSRTSDCAMVKSMISVWTVRRRPAAAKVESTSERLPQPAGKSMNASSTICSSRTVAEPARGWVAEHTRRSGSRSRHCRCTPGTVSAAVATSARSRSPRRNASRWPRDPAVDDRACTTAAGCLRRNDARRPTRS
nr:winged helix-turn-helix domain-containing protein [Nonomuraea diastatica]